MSNDPINLVQRALFLLTQPIERDQPKETLKRDALIIHPGSSISWTRGDGSVQEGTVDLIHMDDTGARWAFVTLGESWVAINMKFVTGSGDE